jgi:CubicO group peptidase (beta-lactamase class C family)
MSSARRLALLLVPVTWLAACGQSVTPVSAPGTEPAPGPYATAAPATTTAPPPRPSPYPPQPRGVSYPAADWPVGELPASVDRAAIDAAVDTAFGAADAAARVRSIVVVNGGRIVYERYHPLDGPDTVFPSFSVAKSFTSALIGLLVSDGRLSLDESPNVPEWPRGDPRRAITLRDLLQMSSGLEWDEVYEAGADPVEMLDAPDAAAYVAAKPLEAEPGTVFEYSTGTTALLAGIAADTLGGCRQAVGYLRERLLDPIGITTADLLLDPGGCWYGGLGADMATRDFARFGLLFLRGGRWDEEQILPTSWVDESRAPAATNPGYGLQWWLDAGGESFRAEGLFGQRIIVVPDLDLVVATNTTPGGEPGPLVDTVLAAFRGEPIAPPAAAAGALPASR